MAAPTDLPAAVRRLERRLHRTQLALAAAVLAGVALAAGRAQDGVIHARGIVLEDAQGRPRLLLGAPTPGVAARRRGESVNGIVLLGDNGSDRVVIASPGIEPQVQGKVVQRSVAVPSAGLLIIDSAGDERGGFGVSDDGTRISLGLDYADRDAMGLLVSPAFSGLAVFARAGELNDQVTLGVGRSGGAVLKVADAAGDEHFMVEAQRDSAVRLLLRNPATHQLQDVRPKLVP